MTDEAYMDRALELAREALEAGLSLKGSTAGGPSFPRGKDGPPVAPALPKAENARKARRLLLTSDPSCKERGYNEMKRNCLLQVL